MVDIEILEHCIREELNKTAPRFLGVLNPLKVVITNYPVSKDEELEAINNPEDPSAGKRKIPFSRTLYIERDDFMREPHKKFYRLSPGREVRLRYAFFMTCQEAIMKNDQLSELRCTIDPETRGGYAPDGRKVKSTIHWVSAPQALNAEIHMYNHLFTVPNPAGQKHSDIKDIINPHSLIVLKECKVEPKVQELEPFSRFQFERRGYFCIDPDTTKDNLIINQTIGLKDTWAKIKKAKIEKKDY
jgi:glutaminyl-tRNA synthetase